MRKVTVNKQELIETLKANQAKHADAFEQVLEDYKTKSIQLLEEHIERIRNDSVEEVFVNLPAPQNYEENYERVIQMAEWEVEEEIVLEQAEFRQYILDEWAWKPQFAETVQLYSS